jgi:hypothetical protein
MFTTTFRLDPAQAEVMRQHDADIADLRRVQDELSEYHESLSPKELVRAWIAIVAIVDRRIRRHGGGVLERPDDA